MRDYRAGKTNGGGAGVRIDGDFHAVFEAAEFNDVAGVGARLESLQAGLDGGGLEFAADVFRHAGKFGETAKGATGGSGEARVGIQMQFDAFQFSGHEYPRG